MTPPDSRAHARFPACMGGWCALRDQCPAYHAELRGQPSERLCRTGQDGHSEIVSLRFTPVPNSQRIASQQVAE